MFTASNGIAVATCALMTPYWFLSSSSAAGTMLKLAAIGVISVPQKPLKHPHRADHRRIAAVLVDQDRDTDCGNHHRECGKGVAHDHREDDHSKRVEQHCKKDAAARNDRADECADCRADARGGKDDAERREHLRQHHRPADRISQPAAFIDRRKCRRTKPCVRDDQRNNDAAAKQHQGDRLGIDQPGRSSAACS